MTTTSGVPAVDKSGLVQFPTVIGGDVAVVNIKGVSSERLRLTGEALGDIYLGKIKKWNEPAIANLNPGVQLPTPRISKPPFEELPRTSQTPTGL